MAEKTDKTDEKTPVRVRAKVAVVEGGTYHAPDSEFELPADRVAAHGKKVVQVDAQAPQNGEDAPQGDDGPPAGPDAGQGKQTTGQADKQQRGGKNK